MFLVSKRQNDVKLYVRWSVILINYFEDDFIKNQPFTDVSDLKSSHESTGDGVFLLPEFFCDFSDLFRNMEYVLFVIWNMSFT